MKVIDLVKVSDDQVECPYCGKRYDALIGMYQHIRFAHNKTSKDVYDELCKTETDGVCVICGKETPFRQGKYLRTCSKDCLRKLCSQDVERAAKISQSRRKYNTESFIEKAKQVHGEYFDYSKTKMSLLSDNITVICPIHGVFTTQAKYHLLNAYGGCHKCASESMVRTKQAWSPEKKAEVAEKRRNTNKAKYGHKAGPAPFGSDEYKKVIAKKYGVENPFEAEEIKGKIRKTNLQRYGVENVAYLEKTIENSHSKEANKKRYETHKKNNSFNSSKPEEDFYSFLLTLFDKEDIFRNYADDSRYPFACDFYIKPLDLFIELNLFFTHGFHWFDENDPEDLKTLKKWQDRAKDKKLYNVAIEVWTKSDPKKRHFAEKNQLNYTVLWNTDEVDEYKKELYEAIIHERINNIS